MIKQNNDRRHVFTMISPRYDLEKIFYLDYHRVIEDLTREYDVSLAAHVENAPQYISSFVMLKNSFLKFHYNRYSIKLSNSMSLFNRLRKMLNILSHNIIYRNLVQYLNKYPPDIVYIFPRYPDLIHNLLKDKNSSKIVVEFWEDQIEHMCDSLRDVGVSEAALNFEKNRGYEWIKTIVKNSDKIIVPTTILKNRLTDLCGSSKKISIVPVCQDPIVIRDPSFIRKKHGLKEEKIIFYMGSLSMYHDLITIFNSINHIKTKDIVIMIAGGSRKTINKYRNIINDLKIPVIYLGKLDHDELEYYLSAADICLGIYKFDEPSGFFPASVIKYMLAKKPIIVTDLPEIHEMFKGLKAGIFIKQNDEKELAAAIDFLFNNVEEGINMGVIAQKIAENNYLWKHHTEALVKIFNSLMYVKV